MDARFRRLAVVTTALTYVLILLGLYTGATAGGLSCGARWPLCNGAVFGLFPANWASFFEWSHRLVAMVVGFLLLGTLYGAWRWQNDRRTLSAITGALCLLPIQVGLGAVTTTAGGAFPGGFNPVVIVTHFSTAATIFALLLVGTLLALPVPGRRRIRATLGVMGVFAVCNAVFAGTGLVPFYPRYQVLFYGASFGLFAGFLALGTWALLVPTGQVRRGTGLLALVGAAAVFLDMVISRRLLGIDPFLSYVTTGLVVVALVAAAWVQTREGDRPASTTAPE